jgi:hypothetical protein
MSPEIITEEIIQSYYQNISCPTLVVVAYRKEHKFLAAFLGLVEKRITYFHDAKVVVVDGEHHVHLDYPERVVKSVIEFILSESAKL